MMSIEETLCSDIAEATQRNDHTDAAILLANYVNDGEAIGLLEVIQTRRDFLGYMPDTLSIVQTKLVNHMLDQLPPLTKHRVKRAL